jgi:integrase
MTASGRPLHAAQYGRAALRESTQSATLQLAHTKPDSQIAWTNPQGPVKGKGRDELIWPSPRGGYISGPSLWKTSWLAMAVARCQKADPTFRRVTPHDLRHTAASLAISAGANPKVVQRMLGHASAAMTLDVYADLFDSDLDSVAESVSKMWPREVVTARPFDADNVSTSA